MSTVGFSPRGPNHNCSGRHTPRRSLHRCGAPPPARMFPCFDPSACSSFSQARSPPRLLPQRRQAPRLTPPRAGRASTAPRPEAVRRSDEGGRGPHRLLRHLREGRQGMDRRTARAARQGLPHGDEACQGIGANGLYGGSMLNLFEANVMTLERRGDQVFAVAEAVALHRRARSMGDRTSCRTCVAR